jgi:hypothetical protein
MTECCDEEDEDGFIPYERKCSNQHWFANCFIIDDHHVFFCSIRQEADGWTRRKKPLILN